MNFSVRSYQKELLDQDGIPFEAIEQNMRELDTINTWLGGHAITVSGLKELMQSGNQSHICEIGCGGGDNLHALYRWCRKKNRAARFTGIDINPHCLTVARARIASNRPSTGGQIPAFEWIASDYRGVGFTEGKPDIIFSALFCHHFTDEQLVVMLQWMRSNARAGFFINDLHRHPLAYYAIKGLTGLFSRSWLVKNDAPLSVLRGFKRREWTRLMEKAGIARYRITWKWAFRWLIVVENNSFI
jgi:ubiquinone/menaquinone biosynthesis C-methylase UbiE